MKKICNNCLLFNREKSICKVAILIEGEKFHMPVDPGDKCHMEELDIPIEQIRWWIEDPKTGKQISENGIVKIEYPTTLEEKHG